MKWKIISNAEAETFRFENAEMKGRVKQQQKREEWVSTHLTVRPFCYLTTQQLDSFHDGCSSSGAVCDD